MKTCNFSISNLEAWNSKLLQRIFLMGNCLHGWRRVAYFAREQNRVGCSLDHHEKEGSIRLEGRRQTVVVQNRSWK
jgi:hypothetical protein